ncbi:MAG: DUF2813 domain-containing protein [Gammaproteobacteria bacterium]|nr:DUF2813 domain-containing protein [Gammaproteobacteria bacterium]
MYLRALRIENFRAIRKSALSFDDGTALIGENDCGITSVLDALELVLGFDEKSRRYPPWLFHRDLETGRPRGPIGIQLRFAERHAGEWSGAEYEPFEALLPAAGKRPRELWYEARVSPAGARDGEAEYRLRSPRIKARSSDPDLIGRFRRMNPVIRVPAGMLSGHGPARNWPDGREADGLKVSKEMRDLMARINRAVNTRLSGRSLDLKSDLEDGYLAAFRLIEMGTIKMGKWEAGLTRSISEIIGWRPDRKRSRNTTLLRDPDSDSERLGILLLIGALIRARPGGMAPDADPLWIIEEPEAHLHPITLTSVAMFVSLIQRQKILTTYSGDLLSAVPLSQLRRLVRHDGELHERRVRKNVLSRSELRRFHYHLRSRFPGVSFSRLWLLVEGESEFWILPQLASLMGYEFALEGISCVEFAQCGLMPPLKVARELGIQWHLLADGDDAGKAYIKAAGDFLDEDSRVTLLRHKDIERFFWDHGYSGVYERASKLSPQKLQKLSPGRIIQAAVRKTSKPYLALSIIEAIATDGSPGIPPRLEKMIESCVQLAREAPERLA